MDASTRRNAPMVKLNPYLRGISNLETARDPKARQTMDKIEQGGGEKMSLYREEVSGST